MPVNHQFAIDSLARAARIPSSGLKSPLLEFLRDQSIEVCFDLPKSTT